MNALANALLLAALCLSPAVAAEEPPAEQDNFCPVFWYDWYDPPRPPEPHFEPGCIGTWP